MAINASHISPHRAIERCLITARGMLALAEKTKDNSCILSTYLEGEPGVGKSAIIKAIAKAMNYWFEDIRANMMNPDDAGGTRMQDMDTKTTAWFAPYWLPSPDGKVIGRDGKEYEGTILFFDELASADDRVRKPLFGVFLDRALNGRPLPRNCLVYAAGNEAESGTMVFELDNATRTRFSTLKIVADFDSWVENYAPGASITPTTVSMLKQNGHRFCETQKAIKDKRDLYGNPRNWEHVSIYESAIMVTPEDRKDEDKREALKDHVAGKVGTELAAEYMGVFDNVANMANLYDLLKASKEKRKELWPTSIGQLYALAYSMMSFPSDIKQGQQIMDLMEEMPKRGSGNEHIPFEEMKAPIREVILKRLKASGIRETDLNRAFSAGSREAVADILANGPLIRIDA